MKRGPIFTYIVTKYPRQDIHWQVSYDQEKLTFGCSCKRLETLGIACEHIIVVLIKLNIVVMPNSLILTRWTKGVKDVVNAANANSSSQRDPTFVTTYVTVVERCKRMVNAAFTCGNPEEIRNTNDMVENQTQRLESFAMGNGLNSSTLGSQPECSLGNPPRVRRKGAISAPSSQTATGVPKRKTQRCGICGREGHNRKSCQFQSEPL